MRHRPASADPIREATIAALELVFDPLLELVFNVGLSVQELNFLIRSRAVHIATSRLVNDAGVPSKSRIAIITGIPRSEVAKLSKPATSRKAPSAGQQPARRCLAAWFSDPRFLDSSGEPLVLGIFGKRLSFEKLVSLYGAGSPVRAMLDELIQIGAVERLAEQRVRTKSRIPVSVGLTPSAIEAAGERCRDLLNTLLKNMNRKNQPLFEATSLISDSDPTLLPMIRREIAEQSANLINATSSILKRSQTRIKARQSGRTGPRVGVTVYYFEDSKTAPPIQPVGTRRVRRKNLHRT